MEKEGIASEPLRSRPQDDSSADSIDSKNPKRDYFPYMKLPDELKRTIADLLERNEVAALTSTCSGLRVLLRALLFESISLVGEYEDLHEKIAEVIRLVWPAKTPRSLEIRLIGPSRDLMLREHISLLALGPRIHDLLKFSGDSVEELTLGWGYMAATLHFDTLALFGAFEKEPLHLRNLRVLRVKSFNADIGDVFFRYLEKTTPCLETVSLTTFTQGTVNASIIHYDQPHYYDPEKAHIQEEPFIQAKTYHEETKTLVVGNIFYEDTAIGLQHMLKAFPRLENLAVHSIPDTSPYDRLLGQMRQFGKKLRKLSLPLISIKEGSPSWVKLLRDYFDCLPELQLFQLVPNGGEAIVWVAKRGAEYVTQVDELGEDEPDLGGLTIEKVSKTEALKP